MCSHLSCWLLKRMCQFHRYIDDYEPHKRFSWYVCNTEQRNIFYCILQTQKCFKYSLYWILLNTETVLGLVTSNGLRLLWNPMIIDLSKPHGAQIYLFLFLPKSTAIQKNNKKCFRVNRFTFYVLRVSFLLMVTLILWP